MPELGLGDQLRREMGPGLMPVPRGPYVDLSSWPKIPFLYTPETRRMVASLLRLAPDPTRMARLAEVLEMELGHELAFAVERGKISANGAAAQGRIEMGFIERGLAPEIGVAELEAALSENRAALGRAAAETIAIAGVRPDQIGRVIMVGGSSLMGFVGAEMRALCPGAQQLQSEAFTAVVDGLAIASRDASRFG
jgi:hypothetical chaperone protein